MPAFMIPIDRETLLTLEQHEQNVQLQYYDRHIPSIGEQPDWIDPHGVGWQRSMDLLVPLAQLPEVIHGLQSIYDATRVGGSTVLLKGVGHRRLDVVQTIRRHLSYLGLREVSELVQRDVVKLECRSPQDAAELAANLKAYGAIVDVI
jgi:hypothetical protein